MISVPLELAHILGVDPEIRLERDLDVDALRDVDEAATAPDSAVERCELLSAAGSPSRSTA